MSWRERAELMKQIRDEGPALILSDSGKTDNLFNMTGTYPAYKPSGVPMAFLAHEDYDLIWRLTQSGPVTSEGEPAKHFQRQTGAGLDHRGGDQGLGTA